MRPRVRSASLTGYADLVRSLGLDPAEMTASVGLDLADLDVPDRWIPGAAAARLLDLSARDADCADLGLRMVQLRRLGSLGPISVVLRDQPDLGSALDLLLHTVVAPGARTAAAQVAETLLLLPPLGRCSMEQVSRHLGLRPRALQHRLAQEGESFSAIVHATRARLVERYMPNDRYSLTEVSQLLGFGAPSAFTRWSHGRFGISPSDWRRTARSATGTAPPSGDDRRPPAPSSGTRGTVREG